ncbi:sensor histidine kinase [Paludicola sp. MB14-C6]|uniref:sensor histidine kinase n=1 Tax=Paludihabitans sp. MB14-C6 TaxID=3070656 RepID=UPI0027DDD291|nr:sensor histidine kinase [Paludicola sp. MB14-C6]WMJ23847.1 sensor histidine kinase [Paludicola sp. MB14-C6]
MKLRDYLRDKYIFIILQILAIAFIAYMLFTFRLNLYAILFIVTILVGADIAVLLGEYIQKQRFYKVLIKCLDSLDQKCLIAELIDKPSFAEGIVLYDVLKESSKSMNDQIGLYKHASEEYREYIETWVHEIKTPIAASKLILENNMNTSSKSVAEEVTKIEAFVEQALFYSKSNTVEKDYIIKECNLNTVVKSCVKKHSKALIESQTSLAFEGLDCIVYTDVKWIDFILGQIIVNSMKYKKETLHLKFYARELSNSVILSIKDNGVGIQEKDLPYVFEKGFTGFNGRNFAKSTGIGLYLCKKLCDKMGLQISISSVEKEGTVVQIAFPKSKMVIFET